MTLSLRNPGILNVYKYACGAGVPCFASCILFERPADVNILTDMGGSIPFIGGIVAIFIYWQEFDDDCRNYCDVCSLVNGGVYE